MSSLARDVHWFNSGTNVIGVNNYFYLDLSLLHKLKPVFGTNQGKEPVGRQMIGPREKRSTIIPLIGHIVKRTPNDCLVYLSTLIGEASFCSRHY